MSPLVIYVQKTFSGSNTDGWFSTVVSKSGLESLGKKSHSCKFGIILGDFLFLLKKVHCIFQLGQLKTGQDGKGLLRIHLWCLDDLPRLWDRIKK